eukprot:jgi/Undpi1/1711/HiC_scaffold_11.g05101.m1
MEENMFLSDYFGCVGFMPFTSQSNIRDTMVKMFVVNSSSSVQYLDTGDDSPTEQSFGTIVPASSPVPVDPSTCVFWSAIALGSLVKGRPVESVEKYIRLAKDALANVSGPPNADVARALAILAYMSDFIGETVGWEEKLAFASNNEYASRRVSPSRSGFGFSDVVRHGETIKMFVGDVDRDEVESFCDQKQAVPQISQAATEGEICRYVLQSYRSFEQAVCQNVFNTRPSARAVEGEDEPSYDKVPPDTADVEFDAGSASRVVTSLMKEQAMEAGYSGVVDMMIAMLKAHSIRFERLEQAANRPNIREGIGGLIINNTLALDKILKNDCRGVLENLERCGAVFERYPGICRFTMGSHVSHILVTNLVLIPDPRARVIYDKIRKAYNSTLFPGTRPIPPFEKWQGLAIICDNYKCRLMELAAIRLSANASSSPPPQARAAVVEEEGILKIPVECRQHTGVASPTGLREEVEEVNSVVVSHPNHNSENAPTSNRELERVSEVGWVVDADVGRGVNEPKNINGCADSGAQAAKAAFSPVLGKGRMSQVDETVYDSIGAEDWLDVTRALLDANTNGLEPGLS